METKIGPVAQDPARAPRRRCVRTCLPPLLPCRLLAPSPDAGSGPLPGAAHAEPMLARNGHRLRIPAGGAQWAARKL